MLVTIGVARLFPVVAALVDEETRTTAWPGSHMLSQSVFDFHRNHVAFTHRIVGSTLTSTSVQIL